MKFVGYENGNKVLADIGVGSTAVNLQQTTNTGCPLGEETVIPIAIQNTPVLPYSIASNRLVIPYAGNIEVTGQFYSETSTATTYTSTTSYVRLYSSTGTLKKTAQVTRPPLNGTWSTLDFSIVFAVETNDHIEFSLKPLVNTGSVICFASDTFFFVRRKDDISTTGVNVGDKGDIVVSGGGEIWTVDNGVINNAKVASNAGIAWTKIDKTGASPGDVGAIASTQLGANNGVAQLGSTGKHLPGQALPNSVTYTASTGVLAFTWADGATQNIDLPVENLFQNASYNSGTQTLTLTTNGGGTLDISLATLVDLPEIVVAQSDPATTPTTGQRLYLRSDTGEYWIAASGAWQGKYLAFTAAERTKLSGIQESAINQTTADGRYRLQSNNIPTSEVTDLAEFVRDTIGATLAQGSNITITPDDPGNTITISATSGGGFTPILAEYPTPGTTALFQPPSGATQLKVRLISPGGGGGGGRQGDAGTARGGGGGGAPGSITDADFNIASIAAFLGTTVSNLRFSLVIGEGGLGGLGATTNNTNGSLSTSTLISTVLRVRDGDSGTDFIISRAAAQTAQRGGQGSTAGGNAGTGVSGGFTANGIGMWSIAALSGAGTAGGSTGGLPVSTAVTPGGAAGGQGLNASNVGAVGFAGGAGATAQYGDLAAGGTAGSKNALQHGIPWVPGGGGAGGDSTTANRNGGDGYRGGGGGGGGASVAGTPAGNGGKGGDGYACLLWY